MRRFHLVPRSAALAVCAASLVVNGCTTPTENKAGPATSSLAESPPLQLAEAIAFVSSRAYPNALPGVEVFNASEIYLMDPACMTSASCPQRLTENTVGDGFPTLSPDGKAVLFDSNRLRAAGEPLNVSDLFFMTSNGTQQTHLVRGSSATWSPDGKYIAFHASASGTGRPIRADAGSATIDSDIFIAKLGELLEGIAEPKNITHNASAVDDDPDWSPDGQTILFTSHSVTDNHNNSTTAEIYRINADGTGATERLTINSEEERAPAWSPDGTRIVFMCRKGDPAVVGGAVKTFEICVMNADGSGITQLTVNNMPELTPTWSLGGTEIMFHRAVAGVSQLFVINSHLNQDGSPPAATQVTNTAAAPIAGHNLFANWGRVRIHFED